MTTYNGKTAAQLRELTADKLFDIRDFITVIELLPSLLDDLEAKERRLETFAELCGSRWNTIQDQSVRIAELESQLSAEPKYLQYAFQPFFPRHLVHLFLT